MSQPAYETLRRLAAELRSQAERLVATGELPLATALRLQAAGHERRAAELEHATLRT